MKIDVCVVRHMVNPKAPLLPRQNSVLEFPNVPTENAYFVRIFQYAELNVASYVEKFRKFEKFPKTAKS